MLIRKDYYENITIFLPFIIIIFIFYPIILFYINTNDSLLENTYTRIKKSDEEIKRLKEIILKKENEIKRTELAIEMIKNDRNEFVLNHMKKEKNINGINLNGIKRNNVYFKNYNPITDIESDTNNKLVSNKKIIGENIKSVDLFWPLDSREVLINFGSSSHNIFEESKNIRGTLLKGFLGEKVMASIDGVVLFVGEKGLLGNTVEIEREDGLKVIYSHLDEIFVHIGDNVEMAQTIGKVGVSGIVDEPSLFYSILIEDIPIDPMKFKYKEYVERYFDSDIN